MTVSPAVRRFRSRLMFLARIKRTSPGTILTLASLSFIGIGIATAGLPWLAFIVVGSLLILLTPIGAALRILLRGR